MNILHLTHTDINTDSRILKELSSIASYFSKDSVYGIGVQSDKETIYLNNIANLYITTIQLKSIKFQKISKILFHTISVLEIIFKIFFKAKKIKPSIIHCHDISVLPLGVLLKIFTGSKLIYDAHELESNRNGLSKTLGKMTLLTEKFLWKFINRLIVVSPSISTWYNDNVAIKATEIILNSPALENSKAEYDNSYLRRKFLIPANSKIFLYIGILGKGRGIDLIIDAFKKKDLNSHIVFLGFGQLKEELADLSKQFSNIHVHDAVPHQEVVSVARSADIGLCLIENISLSDYYCLPNKLFEYTFAEIPVLASNFPDISMVVEKYNLGKCSDLDPESIYRIIKEFEQMNELPIINAEDLYDLSWGAQEVKLVKLYENIIEEINKEIQ